MGKSRPRKKHERGEIAQPRPGKNGPRVLFAIGDAECTYSEGKIWRLARRLKDLSGWDLLVVTNDKERAAEGERLGLQVWSVDIAPQMISEEERLLATDILIRQTADLTIPGSELPLCKVLALDDFAGSLTLWGALPSTPIEADLIIMPMMGVDNNTKGGCGLYTWIAAQASAQGIPILALEVSPLGNKHTLSYFPAQHYAVKSEWSRKFLLKQGIAQSAQVSLLKWEEAYLLWSGQDDYSNAYLEKEMQVRQILNVAADRFVVVIPHHVAFLWEARKILEVLTQVPGPLSVIVRVEARTVRRQYCEREIVMKAYDRELRALPHVIIDERIGMGLLLQLADLVISPCAGTTTERAALCLKPTIICQAMGERGWGGEYLYWEPQPENLPGLIQDWRQRGVLSRTRLVDLARTLLQPQALVTVPQAPDVSTLEL
jgi:hypothetical protein